MTGMLPLAPGETIFFPSHPPFSPFSRFYVSSRYGGSLMEERRGIKEEGKGPFKPLPLSGRGVGMELKKNFPPFTVVGKRSGCHFFSLLSFPPPCSRTMKGDAGGVVRLFPPPPAHRRSFTAAARFLIVVSNGEMDRRGPAAAFPLPFFMLPPRTSTGGSGGRKEINAQFGPLRPFPLPHGFPPFFQSIFSRSGGWFSWFPLDERGSGGWITAFGHACPCPCSPDFPPLPPFVMPPRRRLRG